jgi:HD-GYP domain-containing protein (c-di-GMP phosphodiesterase class II)
MMESLTLHELNQQLAALRLRVQLRPPSESIDSILDELENLVCEFTSLVDSNLDVGERDDNSLPAAPASVYDLTLESWARMLEFRELEPKGHSARLVTLTLMLAAEFGFDENAQAHLRRGVLLHDVGKIGVPDRILLKAGPLSEEEWERMSKHPIYVHQLLEQVPFLRQALEVPYNHHERWDGSGYPRGLKGLDIPLSARLFAVVDVWDSLTSNQPYRPAWKKEDAVDYLVEQSGKLFDPQVVQIFLRIISGSSQ